MSVCLCVCLFVCLCVPSEGLLPLVSLYRNSDFIPHAPLNQPPSSSPPTSGTYTQDNTHSFIWPLIGKPALVQNRKLQFGLPLVEGLLSLGPTPSSLLFSSRKLLFNTKANKTVKNISLKYQEK